MNEWEARYQRGDTGWDRGEASAALPHFIDHTPPQANILVPGCGRGHEVIELAKSGFTVTALDIAPSATTHLSTKLAEQSLHAQLICQDLFTFTTNHPFDAIYEQTSLCAIQPNQRHDYERCLHSWLKPGGVLFALFMQSQTDGGPPFHCDISAMRQLFDTENWQWSPEKITQIPHKSGRFELAYILRKRR
ncbi:MAG: methyltransferase domain-containing protein [Mariprofundales bacterium]|nr:methyltransferase domain-containing protein [Mariprofundales bacterium]